MAAPPDISGPGILFVRSFISRPDIMTEEVFMDWYDNDHIDEVVSTPAIDSAFRYKHKEIESGKPSHPYLAIYPMKDVNFLVSPGFKAIRVSSPMLPGSGLCYDLMGIRVGYYQLVQVYDPTKKGPGHVKSVLTGELEFEDEESEKEADKWYREEHLAEMHAKIPGYLRTTRFKILFARSNAESRTFKGHGDVAGEKPVEMPPKWLAIHEFEVPVEELSVEQVKTATASPWKDKVMSKVTKFEANQWFFVKKFGTAEWFHGEEFQNL